MNRFWKYLKIQSKRAFHHYPIILIFTMILTVCMVLFVQTLFSSKGAEEGKKKFEIGLVGDLSETYLDIGIVALKNMDSSQYYVELTEMSEWEAKEKLKSGELYGYILIPEGFVDSIISGENKPLVYVAASNPATFGPTLTNEMVQILSGLVIQGQNGIYGMIEIADQYDITGDAFDEAVLELNVKYIDTVLDREEYYEHEYVGLGDGLSFVEYYVCAFLILLLLLWGMTCSSLLIKHDMALPRILRSRGYRLPTMILGDYIPFLVMMGINMLLLLGIGGPYLELDGMELFVGAMPVIVMITAMQYLLYELSSNIISGVLMQLFVTVILSYVSGLFYPIYSLPVILQKWSVCLPTGLAFRYLSELVVGRSGSDMVMQIWIYGGLFLIIAMLVRQYKMRSNKYD